MEKNEIFYLLGKRDAAIEYLMMARIANDAKSATIELAVQVLAADPKRPNIHAAWWVKEHGCNVIVS